MAKRVATRPEGHRLSLAPSGRDHAMAPPDTVQALPRTARYRGNDEDDDEASDDESMRSSR